MWKEATLHVLFIYVTIFSWLSNQLPRFFTSEEGRIAVWLTKRESILTFTNCCLVPITLNSVVLSLSISLSISIQFRISVHACRDSVGGMFRLRFEGNVEFLSPAYVCTFGRWRSTIVNSLLTYRMKRAGPRQEP